MKKELAHKEEQARQRQPIRRVEGSGSKIPQHDVTTPLSRSQAIGVQWIRNCQEFQRRDHLYRRNPQWGHRAPSRNQYASYQGRARGYLRGRGGRRSFNQNKKLQIETGKKASKGKLPLCIPGLFSLLMERLIPRKFHHQQRWKKGRQLLNVDVDEEYFDEGDDDMVGTISIIPTEYLGECESNPDEDYDQEDEEAFSFIRIEDEPGFFPRPTERQMSHLRPLHIVAVMNGFKINKVLIDGGAAISLLPERMLGKVGKHVDELVPTNIIVTDFSGNSTPTRGTFGEVALSRFGLRANSYDFSITCNDINDVSRTADLIVEAYCVENKCNVAPVGLQPEVWLRWLDFGIWWQVVFEVEPILLRFSLPLDHGKPELKWHEGDSYIKLLT
ncbi:hypothetical protein Ahy_A07g034052 [Arachis hypogaea]|uniref:Peptidase A2 domain-containing protein n=1 Tax=Arachis hypogaea TaxID=3818 RepID=A0A445CAS3_ARAHY|nr:hypothetical protein Ahy_A07g034052 [Arachis hypogaea]